MDEFEFEYETIPLENKSTGAATVAVQGQHLPEFSQMIASIKVSVDKVFNDEKRIVNLIVYIFMAVLISHRNILKIRYSLG